MRLSTYALIVGVAAILVLAPAAARADFNADVELCDNESADADAGIAACTRQIDSGRWQGHDLAISYNHRGNRYINKGALDRAIADFDQAIRLDPNDAAPYYNRGIAYYKKVDLDRAIADFDQAIRLDPKYVNAYLDRAVAHWVKEDYAATIADDTRAIGLDPNNAVALYWRGKAKTKIGDKAGGEIDIAAAKRINPNVGD